MLISVSHDTVVSNKHEEQTRHYYINFQHQLLYLVHWLGYQGTDDETSWLLAMELGNAKELVADFHKRFPNKPGPLPS